MLGALIIVFRETIEAGIIVGVVLAATRGIPGRGWFVSAGILIGVIGASCVALFASAISDAFEGSGQELFNATILAIAVISITSHNLWMAEHGREIIGRMRQVGAEITEGSKPLAILAVVVAIAVMREGSEVVLFLYGIVIGGTSVASLLAGGALGLAGGALVTALSYFGLVIIPNRYIFSVTSVLLTFLAAGMASQCAHFVQASGFVTALSNHLWDTSWLLSEDSIVGKALHVLIGYNDHPTALEFLVYLGTLATIFLLMRLLSLSRARARSAAHIGAATH
jgi:high-affinity iron transporter